MNARWLLPHFEIDLLSFLSLKTTVFAAHYLHTFIHVLIVFPRENCNDYLKHDQIDQMRILNHILFHQRKLRNRIRVRRRAF